MKNRIIAFGSVVSAATLGLAPAAARASTQAPSVREAPGAIKAFWDPINRVEHVLVQTAQVTQGSSGFAGSFLEDLYYDGHWHASVLSSFANCMDVSCGTMAIGAGLTVNTDSSGMAHAYFVGTDLHVHHLWNSGNPPNWLSEDVTGIAGNQPRCIGNTPSCVDEVVTCSDLSGRNWPCIIGVTLVSFSSSAFNHVFYPGMDGMIREVFQNQGQDNWVGQTVPNIAPTLTAVTGMNLTGLYDGTEQLWYVATDNHFHNAYYDGAWHDYDITARNNVSVFFTPMTYTASVYDPSSGNDIVVANDEERPMRMVSYSGRSSAGNWNVTEGSSSVSNVNNVWTGIARLPTGTGFRRMFLGEDRVLYAVDDALTVTPVPGAPLAAQPNGTFGAVTSPLAVMSDPSWFHAYYIGSDHHVYEAFTHDAQSWSVADLNLRASTNQLAFP